MSLFQDTASGGHLNIEVFWQTSGWFWRRVEDSAPRSDAVGPFTTSTEAYEGAKAAFVTTNLTQRGARLRPDAVFLLSGAAASLLPLRDEGVSLHPLVTANP